MDSLTAAILLFISFFTLCGILHAIGLKNNFFQISSEEKHNFFSGKTVLVIIFIFLLLSKLLPVLIFTLAIEKLPLLNNILSPQMLKMASYSLSSFLTIQTVYMAGKSQNKSAMKELLGFNKTNNLYAASQGFYTFVLAASSVMITAIFLQLITFWIFGKSGNEQSIITYLRDHKDIFGIKILGFLNIVFLAPILEEIVFRGFIQRYLTSILPIKKAILSTSFLFSLAHYSIDQNVGNIALCGSIFVLSIYLGFIYEKTRSLISPIVVHILFNLDGITRIFLSG